MDALKMMYIANLKNSNVSRWFASLLLSVSKTLSSIVSLATIWTSLTWFCCPCLAMRPFNCKYNSRDHVKPNQTIREPPACKFRPCPQLAGCAINSLILPLFQSFIVCGPSSFTACGKRSVIRWASLLKLYAKKIFSFGFCSISSANASSFSACNS